VVEVAANSALTLEQAKETLDQLNIKGGRVPIFPIRLPAKQGVK
jgi:hypothetical protein